MSRAAGCRRRFPRIPSECAVLVTKIDEPQREELSRTRSVGLGGCRFTSHAAYGVDAVLDLLITIGFGVVKCRARVVWEGTVGSMVEIGVEFLEIDTNGRKKIASLFES